MELFSKTSQHISAKFICEISENCQNFKISNQKLNEAQGNNFLNLRFHLEIRTRDKVTINGQYNHNFIILRFRFDISITVRQLAY